MVAEKFSLPELTALRNELLQGGLDARQSAELVQMFLIGRGYGISQEAAMDAVGRVPLGCSIERFQQELESLALAM